MDLLAAHERQLARAKHDLLLCVNLAMAGGEEAQRFASKLAAKAED
jgi:hypothetical protein